MAVAAFENSHPKPENRHMKRYKKETVKLKHCTVLWQAQTTTNTTTGPWSYSPCLSMFTLGLVPSFPAWANWACTHLHSIHEAVVRRSHLSTWLWLHKGLQCITVHGNIRFIKKNKTWPYFSSLCMEQTCLQITQIRVVSETVHIWTESNRGIKKSTILACKKQPIYGHSHLYLCQSLTLK